MLEQSAELRAVEAVVRSLTTAAKTLRLYPPSSPIPMQAMQSAADSLLSVLQLQPTLALVVTRDGFSFQGTPVNAAGVADLANLLTAHGVAQVDFMPGCSSGELSAFIGVILRDAAEVLADGGVAAALAIAGVANIVVSEVVLTTVVAEIAEAEDIDAFLRELAHDEQKLAAWLAAAASGDPGALSDGLAELARAVGPAGLADLEATLGRAYLVQDAACRDTLIGLTLGDGDGAPVLKGMMQRLQPNEAAASLSNGLYAKNMLSMSNVLTSIPFASLDAIIAELRPMLTGDGHTARELEFLDRMLDARAKAGRESPLATRQLDYQKVAEFAHVDPASLVRARSEIGASASTVNTRTVNTMLSLLDQQQDFGLWSKTLQNLASVVPSLIQQGDVALADRVLADLSSREARTTQPWPGLAEQMRTAFERATSLDAMSALLGAVLDSPDHRAPAESILKRIDAPAQQRFVAAALDQRQRSGLETAEQLLGRRVIGLLVALVPDLQWFQVGPVALRLSTEPDLHSRDALTVLARRPDERSRQEVAKALALSPSALGVTILSELLKDPALEVAVAAARSLGHSTGTGSAAALERHFNTLDWTGKDFPLARELLGALAHSPDAEATAVLERIAGQRTLIKRGHFAEVQELSRQALASRQKGGPRS
jgi:hypothetical protein